MSRRTADQPQEGPTDGSTREVDRTLDRDRSRYPLEAPRSANDRAAVGKVTREREKDPPVLDADLPLPGGDGQGSLNGRRAQVRGDNAVAQRHIAVQQAAGDVSNRAGRSIELG